MRTDTFQLPSKKSVRKAGISLRDGVDDEKTRKIISAFYQDTYQKSAEA